MLLTHYCIASNIYLVGLTKFLISILEGILREISYERRDYESVDEKSLSLSYIYMSRETTKKIIHAIMG